MTPTYDETGLRIGEALRRTRARRSIDIATVEAATKVRAKYLRALENEEWDVLPGAAYAKGFLRTYADYLGLDGDALVDEYRRTVDSSLGANQGYSLSEPVLEHHARPGEPRRGWGRRTVILIALAAAILVVLLVVGLVGGGSKHGARHGHHHKGKHGHHASAGAGPGGGKPVTLSLVTRDDMVVCLLPGHGRPLVDSQTLIAGAKEGPFQPPAINYRLDLDSGGAVTLTLNGKPQRVHSRAPASFAIDSGGVDQIDFKGPGCP